MRTLYAKWQLFDKILKIAFLIITFGTLFIQYELSHVNLIFSFLFPYLLFFGQIWRMRRHIKKNPDSQYKDQFKNHSAEHLIANRYWWNRESFYSYGCSNSHIIFWFLVNLILVIKLPVVLAYILSAFISGEILAQLYFRQNSTTAKLFYPLIIEIQNYTLLEPDECHYQTAKLTMKKLKELEGV